MEKVDEPYLKENKAHAKEYEVHLTGDFGPVKVPKNDYFVMGTTDSIPWTAEMDLASLKRIGLSGHQNLFSSHLAIFDRQNKSTFSWARERYLNERPLQKGRF